MANQKGISDGLARCFREELATYKSIHRGEQMAADALIEINCPPYFLLCPASLEKARHNRSMDIDATLIEKPIYHFVLLSPILA
jgi:hypothetical protein